MPLPSVQTVQIVKPYKPLSQIRRENILSDLEMQFTDRIRTEKWLYDLYRAYGSSKRSAVAQVMRCNCQTVYGPKIVFTIRTDRKAVFSDRISLSNRTDRKAVFSDRISLSILDMYDREKRKNGRLRFVGGGGGGKERNRLFFSTSCHILSISFPFGFSAPSVGVKSANGKLNGRVSQP